MIISAINSMKYDKTKITVISGTNPKRNSTDYSKVYECYNASKFIVIPVKKRSHKFRFGLSGLTTFVDAVVTWKPVLVSDNANMGIDVEGLGIGLEYKAGDEKDMQMKMEELLGMTGEEYNKMCSNMREYSKTHNYDTFCEEIINIVK